MRINYRKLGHNDWQLNSHGRHETRQSRRLGVDDVIVYGRPME